MEHRFTSPSKMARGKSSILKASQTPSRTTYSKAKPPNQVIKYTIKDFAMNSYLWRRN